jgi:hypothetical protein
MAIYRLVDLVQASGRFPTSYYTPFAIHYKNRDDPDNFGGSADIFEARLGPNNTSVAVKRIRSRDFSMSVSSISSNTTHVSNFSQSFIKEVTVWKNLKSRHIVPLIAIQEQNCRGKLPVMILEWREHALREFIQSRDYRSFRNRHLLVSRTSISGWDT